LNARLAVMREKIIRREKNELKTLLERELQVEHFDRFCSYDLMMNPFMEIDNTFP
jgi:hypothetical protein